MLRGVAYDVPVFGVGVNIADDRRWVRAGRVKPVTDLGVGARGRSRSIRLNRWPWCLVWPPFGRGCMWQPSWVHPSDVADPSHYAVVRHRLEVRDTESVEKFGGRSPTSS